MTVMESARCSFASRITLKDIFGDTLFHPRKHVSLLKMERKYLFFNVIEKPDCLLFGNRLINIALFFYHFYKF